MSQWINAKTRRWPAVVLTVGVSIGAGLAAIRLSPAAAPLVRWDAASQTAVPSDFLLLMVPASPSVPLCDAPGGVRVGVLDRAMLNAWSEMQAGPWCSLAGSTPRPSVNLADLKFASSEADLPWLTALNKAMTQSPIIEFARSVHAEFEPRPDRVSVTLTVDLGRDSAIYEYDVLAERAIPKTLKRLKIGEELSADLVALRNGATSTIAAAVAATLILRRQWRRVRISH